MRTYKSIDYLSGLVTALPLSIFWMLSAILPVSLASRVGGALFAAIGPRTAKQRHVKNNLAIVLPDLEPAALERVSRDVWRNLGSVMAEYPHLKEIAANRVTIEMVDEVREMLNLEQPFIVLAGHLANWEVLAVSLERLGMKPNLVYAKHRNPIIEWAIQRFRHCPNLRYVDKAVALRAMYDAASCGRSIGLLPDQRVDTGILLEFFDRQAATTISPARIGRRINYPLVPARVQRLANAHFKIDFYPPLRDAADAGEKEVAIDLTRQFHGLLEQWITADPGAWLCTKRRWPKDRVGNAA